MNFDFKLLSLELKTISILDNELSAGEIVEKLGVSKGYISRAIDSLEDKGFIEISKIGLTKKVTLSRNLHASKLKSLFQARSYMPLTSLLEGSGIQILAVLACGSADFACLKEESGLSGATVWRWIKKFKQHAMLVVRNDEFDLPSDLFDIKEFLEYYCSYFAVSKLKQISPAGILVAAHGFEFLFSLNGEITHENVKPTGLSTISEEIPLMLAENYYFYSLREIPKEEIAVHALVIDPHSKRNLTYVILYILKTKLDCDLFLKISKRYGMAGIVEKILNLIRTWKKPEEPYMPDPEYVKEKLTEYKIQWQG